jgi:hypothetical protein
MLNRMSFATVSLLKPGLMRTRSDTEGEQGNEGRNNRDHPRRYGADAKISIVLQGFGS